MTTANTAAVETLLGNARRMGHGSHVAAFAIELVTGVAAHSLCCWCAEGVEGDAVRLPAGGECSRCAYVGRDCLVVLLMVTSMPYRVVKRIEYQAFGQRKVMLEMSDGSIELYRVDPEDGIEMFERFIRTPELAAQWRARLEATEERA